MLDAEEEYMLAKTGENGNLKAAQVSYKPFKISR